MLMFIEIPDFVIPLAVRLTSFIFFPLEPVWDSQVLHTLCVLYSWQCCWNLC